MSPEPPVAAIPLDRRSLLRAALLGTTTLAVMTADPTGITRTAAGLAAHVDNPLGTASSAARAALPTAATWVQLLGHEVVLTGPGVDRIVAQVVDVRDVAHPSPGVNLLGEAYSVLLAAPLLPDRSSVMVTVHHDALDGPSLVLLPVNGDGSWEAVVDRRTPTTTP